LEKSDFEPRIRRARERLATLEAEVKKQADEESQRAELRLVIGQECGSVAWLSWACSMRERVSGRGQGREVIMPLAMTTGPSQQS
jgi:hypothetical protein